MTQQRPPIDLRVSLDHVARGGIPLRAPERLAEEAGPYRRLFTSDLSVNEFLLSRDARCEPISQVMGSSIFHVGQIADYKGETGEIKVISDAHRTARQRAVSRLYQEAAYVGADAVIGARLRERMITMGKRGKGGDDGGEVLEFTVVGTAVRAPWMVHPRGQPIITDLSGQDLWALAQEGYEPCGFLFEFCRYHVWHATTSSARHGELDSANEAVIRARSIAARNITRQAQTFQAEFVVGSDITLTVKEVPCGFNECDRNDLDVDVSWFGTAVRRVPQAARRIHADVPQLILSMTPLGRGKDVTIEAGDDENDVEQAARDAEEDAADG